MTMQIMHIQGMFFVKDILNMNIKCLGTKQLKHTTHCEIVTILERNEI